MVKKSPSRDRAPWSMPYCKRRWSLAERIAYYSKPDPLSGCHIWQGPLRGGYGHLWHQDRVSLAHRLAWTMKHGPISDGIVLRHRCNVRSCVNPDHLVLGTRAENNADIRDVHLRRADAQAATTRAVPGSAPGARPIRIFYDGIELFGDVTIRVVDPHDVRRP